jgi:hypothetical protein
MFFISVTKTYKPLHKKKLGPITEGKDEFPTVKIPKISFYYSRPVVVYNNKYLQLYLVVNIIKQI